MDAFLSAYLTLRRILKQWLLVTALFSRDVGLLTIASRLLKGQKNIKQTTYRIHWVGEDGKYLIGQNFVGQRDEIFSRWRKFCPTKNRPNLKFRSFSQKVSGQHIPYQLKLSRLKFSSPSRNFVIFNGRKTIFFYLFARKNNEKFITIAKVCLDHISDWIGNGFYVVNFRCPWLFLLPVW